MAPQFVKRWLGNRRMRRAVGNCGAPFQRAKHWAPRFFRPWIEQLEERILLDANLPPDIVVGRTLSSYTTGGIQNNQETLTYTVYNETANSLTGVLLTDTLAPGVAVKSASQQPDQSGQKLAWSLGTIQGYDRASITLTINLPSAIPLQLDTGASAFAMLDGASVSNSTPAATLRQGTVDASLLASTPDANTTDPFVQEEAAKLDYDPQKIFDFLHNDISYNSYLGSVRGARGTLWSSAGNALDVASLGVALMRASGIPAQYVSGTLSKSQAQQLILSMFPPSYQTVGYVPAGTQTSDPANDPQLLSETESHYWFQFDAGSGMTDADPLMSGTVGQTVTTSTGTFAAVPDNLRATTEVKLTAEIYSQAAAAFGVGDGLSDAVVLDQTFNDVDLVGKTLSIGNYVRTSGIGALLFSQTTTYTPYIQVGDMAYPDPSQDQTITGQDYQEVLTNFPLGNQVLTGLFLDVTTQNPEGESQTYERTLVDRIGFAARQGGASSQVSFDPNGPPALTDLDIVTLYAVSGLTDPALAPQVADQLQQIAQQSSAISSADSTSNGPLYSMLRNDIIEQTRAAGAVLLQLSDGVTNQLAQSGRVMAYADQPRIILVSNRVQIDPSTKVATDSMSIDLRSDGVRALADPGQNVTAASNFNAARGVAESVIESQVPTILLPPSQTAASAVSTVNIFAAAQNQGIPFITITAASAAQLDALAIPAEAKARITQALLGGKIVVVPDQSVTVNGELTIGWYEIDPVSGDAVGVTEDGGHLATLSWIILGAGATAVVLGFAIGLAHGGNPITDIPAAAKDVGDGLGNFAKQIPSFLGEVKRTFAHAIGWLLDIPQNHSSDAVNFFNHLDPPAEGFLFGFPAATLGQGSLGFGPVSVSATSGGGSVQGSATLPSLQAAGGLSATWQSASNTHFLVTSMSDAAATVTDATGAIVGTGTVALSAAAEQSLAVSGVVSYVVNGQGSLSFYTSADSNLGVCGNWNNYSATVTGNVSITLTVPAGTLTLNGQTLAAGTYTITTTSATLSGSGQSTSPNFAGSASITATNGTVTLGAGSGNVTIGGKSLDVSSGATLDGYSGSITVAAGGGNNTDNVTLNGNAANVLTVSATPNTLTTDQNTPVTFQANVNTSFADSYNLTAQAPPGWTVTIDSKGNVTATPAPGLQGGTYPIQIIAQSTTNPNLVAQTTVNVAITPTQPGITFAVQPDPVFTVPFNGAQLPTAFRATIHNNGPTADTYNLTFANVPSGFTILNSGTSVTIPAGQTGIIGLYLQPNTSQPIPPPGTQLSFGVTATSATNPAITESQTVNLTVPNVDAVTLTDKPSTVNTTPGAPVTTTLTLTNAGNVAENVTLAATESAGLTVSGLNPVSLAVGQSTTETVTLTPDASTPLNSTLQATITATFGPSASPATQTLTLPVNVVVPGADAIANASVAAGQLGNTGLADRLSDLSTALTNLVQNSTSAVYQSQAQASVAAVVRLLSADPYANSLGSRLTADAATLGQAATASQVQAAVVQLGNDLGTLSQTLSDEAAYGLTLHLAPNTATVLAGSPADFDLDLQNTGSQTALYGLSVSGLPANVTAQFLQNGKPITSVTVQPGQDLFGGQNGVILELTETGGSLFPTGFTVTATAEGASEITQSVQGTLTVPASFLAVTEVDANPTFIAPGSGTVDVTAKILNSVNQTQQALASYTVTNPGGTVVFTSKPVPLTLTVQTSLAKVDLGSFDITGLAAGSYTINVTVADPSGKPISGGAGQGSVLIGTPVTATLTASPTTAPAGTATVTNTLTVNSQTSFPNPLTLDGVAATTPSSYALALYRDGTRELAYVSGSNGIDIVDDSNPAAPVKESTFGSGLVVNGGQTIGRVDTIGGADYLIVDTTVTLNAGKFTMLVYSLADPLKPSLVSQTSFPYQFAWDMLAAGNTVLVPTLGYSSSGSEFGNVLAINVSNPAAPTLSSTLYSGQGPTTKYTGAIVNSQIAYVASTTDTSYNNPNGVGQILVDNYSNPQNLTATAVNIPDTQEVLGVTIQGDRALVVGLTGTTGASWPGPFLNGTLTLTLLDTTDPANPQVIGSTFVTQAQYDTSADYRIPPVSLGNGNFAVGTGLFNGKATLMLVDASDPNHIGVTYTPVAATVNEMAVSGNLLYTVAGQELSVYTIGTIETIPITVSVEIPNNSGVSIVPGSFNVPPTQTIKGTNFDTLQWTQALAYGESAPTFTWQSTVSNLQAGQAQDVTLGGNVQFTSQGTAGTIALPPTVESGEQILALSPASQTVAPGAAAAYTVTVTNPTSSEETFNLSVLGVPAGWANLPASVTVPANSSGNVTLTLTSAAFAALGDYGFTVTANDGNGAQSSVKGDLVLAGQAAPVDTESHGIVVTLTPASASAGQGTSAVYTVQLTNTGSADDTFSLATTDLPSGVTAAFSQTTVNVPPGASNFRDVTLILTPQVGTTPGDDPFTVTATSTTDSPVTTTADGTLTVLSNGVSVSLTPSSAAPGSTFQLTVTNTGTAQDTFTLALGGPAALVAQLATNQVTLAAGASQLVNITTGAVNFAVQGPLNLTATATSQTNSAVTSQATAALTIPATTGLTASASPSVQVVPVPGTTSFLVMTNNTGNSQDTYRAIITGTTGPVTANLVGLDGSPTQSVPLFRLPGLSTGALLLQTGLTGNKSGTVTVQVQSLTNEGETASVTAIVNPTLPPPPPPPPPPPLPHPHPQPQSAAPELVGLSSAFNSQGSLATVALFSNGNLDLVLPGFTGLIDTGVRAANLYTDANGNIGLIVVLQGSGATFALDSTGVYFLGQGLLNISPAFDAGGQGVVVDTSPSLQTMIFASNRAAFANLGSVINIFADNGGNLGADIIALPNGMLIQIDSNGASTLPSGVMDATTAFSPQGLSVLDLVMNNGQGLLLTPAGRIVVNSLLTNLPSANMDAPFRNGLSSLADLALLVDRPDAPPVFALTEQILVDLNLLAADVMSVLMRPTAGSPSLGADMARLMADLAANPLSAQLSDFLTREWENDLVRAAAERA